MGAMAEAILAYAQPLLDQTDGSHEQMNNALAMSSLCYNIGIRPESQRAVMISDLQASLGLDDDESKDFCSSIIYPMLERFDEMFPNMHAGIRSTFRDSPSRSSPITVDSRPKSAEPQPYSPSPCNSGMKYKFCCKQKSRTTATRF